MFNTEWDNGDFISIQTILRGHLIVFPKKQIHVCLLPSFHSKSIGNRAYPENTNFDTFVPRNLKFHTFADLHITKKC